MENKTQIVFQLETKLDDVRIHADMLSRACYGFWQKYGKALAADFGENGKELGGAVADVRSFLKDKVLGCIEDMRTGIDICDCVGEDENEDENEDIITMDIFKDDALSMSNHLSVLDGVFYGLIFDAEGWLKGEDKAPYVSDALAELQALGKLTGELAHNVREEVVPFMIEKAIELQE